MRQTAAAISKRYIRLTRASPQLAIPWLWLIVSCHVAGCGWSRPTRETVVPPIEIALKTQTLDFIAETPDGCFWSLGSSPKDFDLLTTDEARGANITKLPQAVRETLAKERGIGLIQINVDDLSVAKHSDVAFPTACEGTIKGIQPVFFKAAIFFRRVTLHPWRAVLTDKAKELGITPNAKFAYAQKRLVKVIGIIEQDATTTLADYEWEWTKTEAGRMFNLEPKGSGTARAVFRKYDDGWRIERLMP